MSSKADFARRLEHGPAFLLLGQRYLAIESGSDPLLREIERKVGLGAVLSGYLDLLDVEIPMPRETWLAWLDERCRRIHPPQWLEQVAEYPWSGLYVSAIDSIWPRAMRRPWRELQPVLEERFKPTNPRNRRTLHCTYLFGSVSRTEDDERPPVTRFEWRRRSQVATALGRRLPELVTPRGTLVIEGYAGTRDWFEPGELMPILADFGPDQVHIFSVDDQLARDAYVKELHSNDQLVLHRESLAHHLGRAAAEGTVRLGPRNERDIRAYRIELEDLALQVPPELWNRVSTTAIVVDDAALAKPPPLSPDAHYIAFRNFLASTEGEPKWAGFARGFAFRRDFEDRLEALVRGRLETLGKEDEPIIVHGQTGSGKTVALAALAYKLRSERRCPVLFLDRRSRRPVPADIEVFCRWCEDEGAAVTLVIWDGMVEPEEYAQLLRYLASHGRRVVVVGSAYRQMGELAQSPNYVLAPGKLSESEVRRFGDFLERIDENLRDFAVAVLRLHDETFLVALYRLLPSTRSAVRHGVAREMEFVEAHMARKASDTETTYVPTTALGAALLAAGLVGKHGLSQQITRLAGGEQVDDFQDLANMVMVPGRFGLHVPLELLLRALGHAGYTGLVGLLEGVDIIRWFEDPAGNIELGPRNALEARLLVQSRIGGAPAEIEYIKRLLLEVSEATVFAGTNREAAFAADLLREFGPKSSERAYFAPYFRELAWTLRQLREERGFKNPGLMLAEANLQREWAQEEANRSSADQQAISEALDEAHDVLSEALLVTPADTDRDRRLRASLLVERATTIGVQCRQLLRADSRADARYLFDDLRRTFIYARQENPSSYYPIDVLAWATRNMLEHGGLNETEKAEAIADLLYAFDTAEARDFDSEQIERLHRRRLELGMLIDDFDLTEDAFERLKEQGSTAGYYLRAMALAGKSDDHMGLTAADRLRACSAMAYLEDHRSAVSDDARPLTLLLQLTWACRTGERLFDSDRHAPPLTDAEWRHLLQLIRQIESTGQATRWIDLAYLRGLCLFHLNILGEAFTVFREVEQASYAIRSRRRLVRAYIASNPDGTPRVYHGTIARVTPDERKGEVFVEEIRRPVQFLAHEFSLAHPERGLSMGEFYIAFNYLGPIAEPIHFHRSSRKRASTD